MASASPLLEWFTTKNGRKCMRYVAYGVCIGSGLATIAPHWAFLDKYKEFKQMYRHGEYRPLSDQVLKIANEELEKCTFIKDTNKNSVKFFTVSGFDVFNAGSVHLNNGSIIGLPVNFGYSSVEDIERKNIEVGGKKVKWKTDAGKLLEDSLIISEKAQRFAISRELYNITYDRHLNMAAAAFLTASVYSVATYLNHRLLLFSKQRFVRFTLYSILLSTGLVTWLGFKDLSHVLYDQWADAEVAGLGPEYIEGGIEFYTKCMQKNAALHVLLDSNGGNWYTSTGNYNTLIRTHTMPLTQRLDELRKKQKALNEGSQNEEKKP